MTVINWHNKAHLNTYRLQLRDRQIVSIEQDGRRIYTFAEPDNQSNLPKLYVVKHHSNVVYFGQTTQNIRTRLRQGLQANGSHGYWGYHWRDLPEVDLLLWCFPDLDSQNPKYVETTEGELVFLFRKYTGKWPEHHAEIHFHNGEEDEVGLAEAIFKDVTA